jgi:hypothetical protein
VPPDRLDYQNVKDYVFPAFTILFSTLALGDELDLKRWEELQGYANAQKTETARLYVPEHFQPATTKEGVFQQVLNYQVSQGTFGRAPAKIVDSKWSGDVSSSDTNTGRLTPPTTYEIKPLETKGYIAFPEGKAAFNYQPWSRETEFRMTPDKSHFYFSYKVTPMDSQNKLMYRLEW